MGESGLTPEFDSLWDLAVVKWVFEAKNKTDPTALVAGENPYRCPECGSEEFMVFHMQRSDVHTGNQTEVVDMEEGTEVCCMACGNTIGLLEEPELVF